MTLGKALQVLLCSVQFSFLFKEVNILLFLKYIKSPTSVARQQRKGEKDSASKEVTLVLYIETRKKSQNESSLLVILCYHYRMQ